MHHTTDKNGLNPTQLLFVILPQFPSGLTELPQHRDRMKAMKLARNEMVKAMAFTRLSKTKQVWLNIDEKLKSLSVDKVKKYHLDSNDGDVFLTKLQNGIHQLREHREGNTEVPETPSSVLITEEKVRYIGQGFKDNLKPFLVHNNPTMGQSSNKLIVSTSVILRYRLALHDIIRAYLQSKKKFSRLIYLKPRSEDLKYFVMAPDEVMELLEPLYGICDAGDYWGATLAEHVRNELKMTPLIGDLVVLIDENNKDSSGILGSNVDDLIFAGTPK
eukprot:IDg912t1